MASKTDQLAGDAHEKSLAETKPAENDEPTAG
jgi:hypothetical protein